MSVAFALLTFKICSERLFYTSRTSSQEGFSTDNMKCNRVMTTFHYSTVTIKATQWILWYLDDLTDIFLTNLVTASEYIFKVILQSLGINSKCTVYSKCHCKICRIRISDFLAKWQMISVSFRSFIKFLKETLLRKHRGSFERPLWFGSTAAGHLINTDRAVTSVSPVSTNSW